MQTPTQAPSSNAAAGLAITAPLPGQALQGSISIRGTSAIEDFASVQVLFSYQNDLTGTWFLIAESDQAVSDGDLAQWDTTLISDGIYSLRMLVTRQDGSQVDFIIPGVRVRNYTTIETDTPTPILPSATFAPGRASATPTITNTPLPPTSTALPPNPAELSRQDVLKGVGIGGLAVLGLFALLGAYVALQRLGKR